MLISKEVKLQKKFIKDVLSNYKKYGRHNLVWRKNITPYRILVSEVMLQQTQVSRVVPKFIEWMKKFPTLTSLKKASFQEALILWQGLGYQRRVKNLLIVATTVTRLPKTYDELCLLPGIGPYTASAICAFAHNTFEHPLLETNIRTALIEYFHQGENKICDEVLYKDLYHIIQDPKIKKIGARDFYYALMDYGAYLKSKKISHNKKSAHYVPQSSYKGSFRELRAKVLFAIAQEKALPTDERLEDSLSVLIKEGYLIKNNQDKYLLNG